ncbi:MAG: hypothetical protein E3K36_10700 [Candidatus Brocadia sp.]|nr:hypothetical protein [Candidatus Brocadia sp.]
MEDIPETVQWVLDFLNIKSKPGHPNQYMFPYERRYLKRPPLPQDVSHLVLEHDRIINKVTGYEWQIIKKKPTINISKIEEELKKLRERRKKLLEEHHELIDYYEDMVKKSEKIVPKQNNSEVLKRLDSKKDIIFGGINAAPSLKDFKEFFLKAGITPKRGDELVTEDGRPLSSLNPEIKPPGSFNFSDEWKLHFENRFYSQLLDIRGELSRILANLVWNTKTYDNERPASEVLQSYMETIRKPYLEWWKEDELPAEDEETFDGRKYRGRNTLVMDSMQYKKPFPHYGMIPHAIYACILDFGINNKELHSRLKQCPLCGTFFIRIKSKGQPRKYCKGCEDIFNQPSRKKNSKASQECKRRKKISEVNNKISKLTHYFEERGYPKEEAKIMAKEAVRNGETIDDHLKPTTDR